MGRTRKKKTFAEEIQDQLNQPMKDANGNQVQINGKNATVIEALARQTIQKAFKDPRVAITLIEKFGTTGTTSQLDDFMKNL